MFYILSKTFDILVMPLTLAFMLIIYGMVTKNRARSRRAIGGALLGLYLVSNPILVTYLLRWWEPRPPKVDQNYEVGVVLMGGTIKFYNRNTNHFWVGDGGDRAVQAFELYKEGKIKKIILSGGYASLVSNKNFTYENDGVREYLIRSGVAPADIIQESSSRNTRENAAFTAKIMKERFHTDRCILITSAFHLRRATGCFEKVGLNVLPFGAHYLQDEYELWIDKFFPAEEALMCFYFVWHEMVGCAVYKLAGYI